MGDFGVLTQTRAKGALTFAGIFRVIDFPLSNLVNAGVGQIGLIIQYLPGSLIEHVQSGQPWDLDNYGKALKIMPPFVGLAETVWYNGTADALYRNLNFVRENKAEHVIVLSGEHVFHTNFEDMVQQHIEKDADLTVMTRQLPKEEQSLRFGYVKLDDTGRVLQYNEKPPAPTSDIAATGIYIFKASVLQEMLSVQTDMQNRNLAKDVLQPFTHQVKAYEYRSQECWEYMETVQDYFDVQRDLTQGGTLDTMRRWNIMTNLKFRNVGHAYAPAFGKDAEVSSSLISPACNIQGTVINSILSPGVKVAAGAVVSDSIIMHDCVIGEGAHLEYVISDRDTVIGNGCHIGSIPENYINATTTSDRHPLALIGKGAQLGKDITIPAGSQIRPNKVLETQNMAETEV